MRKSWQVLWLCGVLCVPGLGVAQGDAPEAGVVIPELDVADSVRRMLEASRKEQGEAAAEGGVSLPLTESPAAAVPRPVPTAPPAAEVPASVAPPAAKALEPRSPPATTPSPASSHVELPAREITIRSTDDIRALARELEEAKRHQQR